MLIRRTAEFVAQLLIVADNPSRRTLSSSLDKYFLAGLIDEVILALQTHSFLDSVLVDAPAKYVGVLDLMRDVADFHVARRLRIEELLVVQRDRYPAIFIDVELGLVSERTARGR